MNAMPFASQKTDAIFFPADETTFAFFGGGTGRQPGQLLVRRQMPRHPSCGNLRHSLFVVHSVLYSLTGEPDSI